MFHGSEKPITSEDLQRLRSLGIATVALSPVPPPSSEWGPVNELVLRASRSLGAVPVAGTSPQGLQRGGLKLSGFGALRLYASGGKVAREALNCALSLAEEAGLPLIVQVRLRWGDPIGVDLGELCSAASEFRGVTVVLSGVNYSENVELATVVRRTPNVCVDIAYHQGLLGVEFLVRRLGSKRVLFGTAYPLMYPECSVLKALMAKLSDSERYDVLRGNAERMLGLG